MMALQTVAKPTQAAAPVLQKKTMIGPVDDPLEREADQVADQVMRMPDPTEFISSGPTQVSRKCAHCEEEKLQRKCASCEAEEKLQRKADGASGAQAYAPPIVHSVLSQPGQPLDRATRSYFEPRFGRDFSQVRVHSGVSVAAEAARAVDAIAYTIGNDIVFDSGRFQPQSLQGKRLLAHELTHVVQQQGGPQVVQRDFNPVKPAPQSSNPLGALFPQISPEVSQRFSVRAFTEAEFQALTGVKVSTIPEKRVLSPAETGLDSDTSASAGGLVGMGVGVLLGPRPTLPLPLGSTGALWSADAHLSQFAVVPQENPALAFFFGDSTMDAYGFRSNLARHIGSSVERMPDTAGWKLTASLNRGVPGSYVNDAVFPYLPFKGGSMAVYEQNGAANLPGAQDLAACMAKANKSDPLNGTYTFSTPPRKSAAYDRAFGKGAAADLGHQPPPINNCLNEANAANLTHQALQGRDLIMKVNGRDVNVGTAQYVDTGELVPDMLPGAAKNMRPYLDQWDVNPGSQGLTRTPITGAMSLRGLTGVVRIGGLVLMVYNLGRIADRYDKASAYDKPLVVGEEGTLLTAGLLGGLLGEVIGETVLCVGAGPGVGLCVIAASVVGGALASGAAEDFAHDVGQTLQTAAELQRQGKLLPAVLDAATQVLGTDQQRQILRDFKKIESRKPEPSEGFELFKF